MLCAVCLYIVKKGLDPLLTKALGEVTRIHGTSLCEQHACETMRNSDILQSMGLR